MSFITKIRDLIARKPPEQTVILYTNTPETRIQAIYGDLDGGVSVVCSGDTCNVRQHLPYASHAKLYVFPFVRSEWDAQVTCMDDIRALPSFERAVDWHFDVSPAGSHG